MKVAILYPTVAALIEKMASLFPGITVVGPPCDDIDKWDKRILPLAKAIGRQAEWKELGLDIHFDERPYSEIDFSQYDLLIESVETFFYAADWKNHCTRAECPIIVKVCWSEHPQYFPAEYIERMKNFPVLIEMPSHYQTWKESKFTDVTCVPEPVGDWWFERTWTGEIDKALFVLAGKDIWRPADETVCGVDLWRRIEERFPGQTYHHDGAIDFKTAWQMTELLAKHRVFVNLDRKEARPLAAVFTEAVAAGMPVVARDHPTLSYKNFIDTNGVCTEDFETMCQFIGRCLSDWDYARRCSARSREIGRACFSTAAVRPIYEAAAERARKAFRSRSWK
jgi:hypothetical protein